MQNLFKKFRIPKSKLDTVFKATIAEARKRTLQHFKLPPTENLKVEYVTNKPWIGFSWYKGEYKSIVQINTDLPILIDDAFDIGSHESYPGHHVYNMLLEKNLYHVKGWVELSISPVFSPQALIAEGSANFGVDLIFPINDKISFAKNVLLPLSGLDTTDVTTYFKVLEAGNKLNYVTNEAARGLINGTMNRMEALKYLGMSPGSKQQIEFIKKYRSYVINYNYGKDIVKNYIERNDNPSQLPSKRWELFEKLLTNEVLTEDLLKD